MANDAAVLGLNRAKGMVSTSGGRDKVPSDDCRVCGVRVYFDTRDGELVALEWDRDTLHVHQEGA